MNLISTQVAQRPAPPGTRGSTAVWYFAARGTGVWLGVGASTEVVGGADAAWREPAALLRARAAGVSTLQAPSSLRANMALERFEVVDLRSGDREATACAGEYLAGAAAALRPCACEERLGYANCGGAPARRAAADADVPPAAPAAVAAPAAADAPATTAPAASPDPRCALDLARLAGLWTLALPVFYDTEALAASEWSAYVDTVYGSLDAAAFPLDLRCVTFFYHGRLPAGVKPQFERRRRRAGTPTLGDVIDVGARGLAWEVYVYGASDFAVKNGEAAPGDGRVVDRGRVLLAPADNTTVEVWHDFDDCRHATNRGAQVGYWGTFAPGSGVAANLGRTLVSNGDGYRAACVWLAPGDSDCRAGTTAAHAALRRHALAAGYDSLVSCCGHRGSHPQRRYEVVFFRPVCPVPRQRGDLGACPGPGLVLVRALGANRTCACDNGFVDVNCDAPQAPTDRSLDTCGGHAGSPPQQCVSPKARDQPHEDLSAANHMRAPATDAGGTEEAALNSPGRMECASASKATPSALRQQPQFCTQHWTGQVARCQHDCADLERRMCPATYQKRPRPHLLYAHVEKTGGSSVECAAQGMVRDGLWTNLGHATIADVVTCRGLCSHGGVRPQTVVSVREPYSYWRSLYAYAHFGRHSALKTHKSFAGFMEDARAVGERLAAGDVPTVDVAHLNDPGVHLPNKVWFQSECIKRSCGRPCDADHYLRTESLDRDWRDLLRRLDLPPVALPHTNVLRVPNIQTIFSSAIVDIIHTYDAPMFDEFHYIRRADTPFELGAVRPNATRQLAGGCPSPAELDRAAVPLLGTLVAPGARPEWDTYLARVYGGPLALGVYPFDLDALEWLFYFSPLGALRPVSVPPKCAVPDGTAWIRPGRAFPKFLAPSRARGAFVQRSAGRPFLSLRNGSRVEVMDTECLGYENCAGRSAAR